MRKIRRFVPVVENLEFRKLLSQLPLPDIMAPRYTPDPGPGSTITLPGDFINNTDPGLC